MANFTRVADGATFTFGLIKPSWEAFGVNYDTESISGDIGESVVTLDEVSEKTFDIMLFTNDTTHVTTSNIRKFFALPGWYTITDTKFNLTNFKFRKTDLNLTDEGVVIEAMAKYGDFTKETSTSLFSVNLAAGADFAGFTGTYTNNSNDLATIELTITPATIAVWNPGIEVGFGSAGRKLLFVLSCIAANGSITSFRARNLVIDSYRLIQDALPFRRATLLASSKNLAIDPGKTVTVVVNPIAYPFTTSLGWNISARGVSRQQEVN